MKRASTLLLGGLAALALAACNPPRNDATTGGGTGSESGSMSGTPSTGTDTTATGAVDTGATRDSTRADTATR